MTTYVPSQAAAAGGTDEILSPELVLVDPALARVARARLPDPMPTPRIAASAVDPPRVVTPWIPDELERPERWRASPRVLVGVATATVLALLLFDVRVEVGERPAAAEPQPTDAVATPDTTSGSTPAPAQTSSTSTERKFAWAPVPGATGYHVEFFRGPTRVYAIDTTRPELTVPSRWSFEGASHALEAGDYQWYVWAVVDGRRESGAVVQTTISIPRTG